MQASADAAVPPALAYAVAQLEIHCCPQPTITRQLGPDVELELEEEEDDDEPPLDDEEEEEELLLDEEEDDPEQATVGHVLLAKAFSTANCRRKTRVAKIFPHRGELLIIV